jgi:hypothetical protein
MEDLAHIAGNLNLIVLSFRSIGQLYNWIRWLTDQQRAAIRDVDLAVRFNYAVNLARRELGGERRSTGWGNAANLAREDAAPYDPQRVQLTGKAYTSDYTGDGPLEELYTGETLQQDGLPARVASADNSGGDNTAPPADRQYHQHTLQELWTRERTATAGWTASAPSLESLLQTDGIQVTLLSQTALLSVGCLKRVSSQCLAAVCTYDKINTRMRYYTALRLALADNETATHYANTAFFMGTHGLKFYPVPGFSGAGRRGDAFQSFDDGYMMEVRAEKDRRNALRQAEAAPDALQTRKLGNDGQPAATKATANATYTSPGRTSGTRANPPPQGSMPSLSREASAHWEQLPHLLQMGFDREQARCALHRADGDTSAAVSLLLSHSGQTPTGADDDDDGRRPDGDSDTDGAATHTYDGSPAPDCDKHPADTATLSVRHSALGEGLGVYANNHMQLISNGPPLAEYIGTRYEHEGCFPENASTEYTFGLASHALIDASSDAAAIARYIQHAPTHAAPGEPHANVEFREAEDGRVYISQIAPHILVDEELAADYGPLYDYRRHGFRRGNVSSPVAESNDSTPARMSCGSTPLGAVYDTDESTVSYSCTMPRPKPKLTASARHHTRALILMPHLAAPTAPPRRRTTNRYSGGTTGTKRQSGTWKLCCLEPHLMHAGRHKDSARWIVICAARSQQRPLQQKRALQQRRTDRQHTPIADFAAAEAAYAATEAASESTAAVTAA